MRDRRKQPPDGSAKGQLPRMSAEVQKHIIIAAAAISGKPANEITLAKALETLQGDNPNPILKAAMNRVTEDAAAALFGDLTDDQAAELIRASENGELQEDLKAVAMILSDQIKKQTAEQGAAAADQQNAAADQQAEGAAPVKENPAAGVAESLLETERLISESIKAAYPWIRTAASISNMITEQGREIKAGLSELTDTLVKAAQTAAFAMQPGTRESVREALKILAENAPVWLQMAEEGAELEPYINAELKKPEYGGKTFEELYEAGTDEETGEIIPGSLYDQLITAAQTARDTEKPHTTIKRAQTVEYPLDKPNSIIWSLLEKDTAGQISFNLAKTGSKKQIPAYYAINFDDLGSDIKITKRLLPFDKRVYIAISGLFNAGNNVITLSQIHYAMGNTGRPATSQLEKINESISKMTGAKIFFDNKAEAEAYKNYTRFKYDGSLLPLERGTAIVNGQLSDAVIHIFREPPLISFAKQRRQITTIDVKLLQSPVSKTDANLQIEDYLLERISRAQNTRGKSCRILFDTLYKHAGITTKKQKQRAPSKIEKYLTHYQQQKFICGYTIEDDGITIHWK